MRGTLVLTVWSTTAVRGTPSKGRSYRTTLFQIVLFFFLKKKQEKQQEKQENQETFPKFENLSRTTPRTNTNANEYSYSSASCSVCEASIRPTNEYLLQNMGQVFRPLDEYPFQNMGQVFRPLDKYPLQRMGQVIVLWTNTLSSTWGKYSSTDEYPLRNTG